MSLLLDALKKAALEKQRREQSSAQTNTSSEPAAISPEKSAQAKNPDKQTPPGETLGQNVSPVESTIAATINDLDQLNPELEAVASRQIIETEIPAKTEASLAHQGADLVFDINEIDPSYLEPEARDEASTDTLPGTGIVEEFVRRANERNESESGKNLVAVPAEIKLSDSEPEKVKSAEIKLEQTKLTEIDVELKEIKQAQVGSATSVADPVAAPTESKISQNATANEQVDHTQHIKALFDDKVSKVEAFSALSGKAALAQLLDRSKKAANAARKRMYLMYGFLSITAILMVAFYYYLLHSEAPGVVAVVPQNHIPATTEAVSPNPVSEAAAEPASELGGVPESTTTQTQALNPDESGAVSGSFNANATAQANQMAVNGSGETQKVEPQRKVHKPTKLSQESPTHEVLPPVNAAKQAMIVEHNAAVDGVSEAIDRGYKAYQRGDISAASEAYQEALRQDPYQRDAMLGAAAVAVRQGRQQDALKIYQQRLARDPKDQYAQSGILALSENADQNPELDSELSRLLLEYPDASHLHFLKGSLYAARQQWAAAQVSFFEAWQRDNKNPDLAFNLAVTLDHLAQPKEAARFYHQALTLGESRPASFSANAIQRRLQDLEGATR